MDLPTLVGLNPDRDPGIRVWGGDFERVPSKFAVFEAMFPHVACQPNGFPDGRTLGLSLPCDVKTSAVVWAGPHDG